VIHVHCQELTMTAKVHRQKGAVLTGHIAGFQATVTGYTLWWTQSLCCGHQVSVDGWPKAIQAMRFDSVISNADHKGSGFAVRNNVIMNNRGKGMVIKSGAGVIEGNAILGPAWWGMQVRVPSPPCERHTLLFRKSAVSAISLEDPLAQSLFRDTCGWSAMLHERLLGS
jgi:hypothetical protein